MRKFYLVVLVLFIITGCSKTNNNDKDNKGVINNDYLQNDNAEIIKDVTLDNVIINDVKIIFDGSTYQYNAVLTSTIDNNFIDVVKINIYGDDDTLITSLMGYVSRVMSNEEKFMINCYTDIDIVNISRIDYEIVR